MFQPSTGFSSGTNQFLYRTWSSTVDSSNFCVDGTHECLNAKLPLCQDRTIQCLDSLPNPTGLIKTDKTDNNTLNSHSLGAKFSYTCQTPGVHSSKTTFTFDLSLAPQFQSYKSWGSEDLKFFFWAFLPTHEMFSMVNIDAGGCLWLFNKILRDFKVDVLFLSFNKFKMRIYYTIFLFYTFSRPTWPTCLHTWFNHYSINRLDYH